MICKERNWYLNIFLLCSDQLMVILGYCIFAVFVNGGEQFLVGKFKVSLSFAQSERGFLSRFCIETLFSNFIWKTLIHTIPPVPPITIMHTWYIMVVIVASKWLNIVCSNASLKNISFSEISSQFTFARKCVVLSNHCRLLLITYLQLYSFVDMSL